MKKYKILVFSQSFVGGAERMLVTVTKTLDKNKFDVIYYLVSPNKASPTPLKDFIPEKFSVKYIYASNPYILLSKYFFVLLKENPSIVFSSVLNINNKLLFLKRFFKNIKFLVRCDNYLFAYNDSQKALIRKTYFRADIIIAQTEEMKQELLDEMHLSANKVIVLHNPVDTETIDLKLKMGNNPYPQKDIIRFVSSGRFAFQKGFDLLIQSFDIVKRILPNAELYIVGKKDGSCMKCYKQISELLDKYGLCDSVKCVGFQSNPYVYVRYADCFVLSSRWEGLPNVMIESLYLGTPIAAFKCIPIIERIIRNGKNGFLADAEDVNGLADAMLKACNLGRIKSDYKPAKIEDFHRIINSLAI